MISSGTPHHRPTTPEASPATVDAQRARRIHALAELAERLLACGESASARATLSSLAPADFGPHSSRAEGLLAILRDRRATAAEITLIIGALRKLLPHAA